MNSSLHMLKDARVCAHDFGVSGFPSHILCTLVFSISSVRYPSCVPPTCQGSVLYIYHLIGLLTFNILPINSLSHNSRLFNYICHNHNLHAWNGDLFDNNNLFWCYVGDLMKLS